MVFFTQKTPVFLSKKGYGLGGYPSPPFTDKIRKVVFDPFPMSIWAFPNAICKPLSFFNYIFANYCKDIFSVDHFL